MPLPDRPCCGLGPALLAPFQGPSGKSAYDLWRDAGNTGSVQDFLASLVSTVPGPPGPYIGGGFVVMTERTVGPEDYFAAGSRQQLRFTPDPTLTKSRLNPPFKGHMFWVNNRIIARAIDDQYDITVNLIVVSDVAGGTIKGELDVGAPLAPIASDSAALLADAQVPERISLFFAPQVGSNFLTNGAAVMLTADKPVRLTSETVYVRPRSINIGDAG